MGCVLSCSFVLLFSGCSDTVTTDFISLVESAKQKDITRGSRVRDFYKVKYDIIRPQVETDSTTGEVTVTNLNNTSTWKLAYVHRDGKWRFQRDKSRRFTAGAAEGAELADSDIVWKQFITQELE
jgi:hypothetical protein